MKCVELMPALNPTKYFSVKCLLGFSMQCINNVSQDYDPFYAFSEHVSSATRGTGYQHEAHVCNHFPFMCINCAGKDSVVFLPLFNPSQAKIFPKLVFFNSSLILYTC